MFINYYFFLEGMKSEVDKVLIDNTKLYKAIYYELCDITN